MVVSIIVLSDAVELGFGPPCLAMTMDYLDLLVRMLAQLWCCGSPWAKSKL